MGVSTKVISNWVHAPSYSAAYNAGGNNAECIAHPRCAALWFLSLIAVHNPVMTGSIPARVQTQ